MGVWYQVCHATDAARDTIEANTVSSQAQGRCVHGKRFRALVSPLKTLSTQNALTVMPIIQLQHPTSGHTFVSDD